MLRAFLVVCLAGVCLAQGDLDALIDEVFVRPGKPNLTPSKVILNPGPVIPPVTNPVTDPPSRSGGEAVKCTTSEGQEGECVQYYLCSSDNNIINDGVGIIDIRRGEGACDNYMDVCCLLPEVVIVPITPPPPAVPAPTGCGIRNPEGVGFRITGDKDNESQFGEFPWMVAILKSVAVSNSQQKLNVYQCGGSLIHPKVVLTAAHCVMAAKGDTNQLQLKVRAGEWDTQTKDEIFAHQDRNVASIKTHDQYYAGGLFYDIALLILEEPVDTTADNVGVVCLPPKADAAPLVNCVASGWGKDVFGKDGRYQVILKKVELPIVDRAKCQSSLRRTRLGQHFELHRTFICAGGVAGKDTCKGDGGSPLVCPMPDKPDRYMQSGIVAWGIGCGENSTPGVYANVAFLRDWINDQLYLENIDLPENEA